MRGVDNIVAMRKRGLKPAVVWVEMLPMLRWARELTRQAGRYVDIHVDPSDVPAIQRADLRCLVGLRVMVNGPDDDSTEKVAKACFEAGATNVQAFFFDIDKFNPHKADGGDSWLTKALRIDAEGTKTVWPK